MNFISTAKQTITIDPHAKGNSPDKKIEIPLENPLEMIDIKFHEKNEIEEDFNKKIDFKYKSEDFITIKNLRNIYICLLQAHADKDIKLFINKKGFLKLSKSKSLEMTDLDKVKIQQNIFMNISSALKSEIFNFLDDKGHLVHLRVLEKLARKIFDFQTDISQDVEDFFEILSVGTLPLYFQESELNYSIETLTIPDSFHDKFTDNEKFCIGLLQRLYPENTDDKKYEIATLTNLPRWSPDVFLFSFNQFISTPQLLKMIKTMLEWPEENLPILQKVRILNFLRMLVKSFSYRFEVKSHTNKILKILEIGKKIGFESECLSEEIYSLLNNSLPSKKVSGPEKLNEFFKGVLKGTYQDKKHFMHMIDMIAEDLKILAGEAMYLISPEELSSDKKNFVSNRFDSYETNLRRFILNLFDRNELNISADSLLRFCFHLASASLEKNDFFTSFIIYSCITTGPILELYEVEHPKKISINPKSYLKKSSLVILSSKTWEIQNELSILFSLKNNRAKMISEIFKYNKQNILVIPEISLLKSCLINMKANYELHEESLKIDMAAIDMQIIHDTSHFTRKVESIMDNVILYYENSPDLQTDLKSYIGGLNRITF